jgi:thiol:disulfide interchange protein DsbD
LTARRGFALSGVYVLAMAGAFGLLGVIAAWSGQNLQIVLQSPMAIYFAAAVFVLLALSMFGLFELQLPATWTRRLSSAGASSGGTVGGAAALGFTSALIMGPCVTAPLAGALLYIAGTGDVTLGAAALFALGLGQGVPLLIVGALGARVLPKAVAWMKSVKYIFGFIFLGMAVWLIGRVVTGPGILLLWSLLLIGGGVFSGVMDQLPESAGLWRRATKTASVSTVIVGAIMMFGAALGGDDPLRPLNQLRASITKANGDGHSIDFINATTRQSLETALAEDPDKPVLVYVTADWCVTCRVIEREVWADASVQTALSGLSVIAADVSDFGAEGQAMLDQLGAVGPPTMVFLNRDRAEEPGTRIVGDATAKGVIASAEVLR